MAPCQYLDMPDSRSSERAGDTDAAALNAIAELFRLPEWRIGNSQSDFLEKVAVEAAYGR
jgi:hypothetical protein